MSTMILFTNFPSTGEKPYDHDKRHTSSWIDISMAQSLIRSIDLKITTSFLSILRFRLQTIRISSLCSPGINYIQFRFI